LFNLLYENKLKEAYYYYVRDMANIERREGRREGRRERSRQIAVKLLQRNMHIEDVISLTDLTKEEVQELLK